MTNLTTFPGNVTQWNGFERHDFRIDEYDAILVKPKRAAEGCPWIWRARFFDAWPAVDISLVSRGFHLAHVDAVDLFGNSEAMRRFDVLYSYLTRTMRLAGKTVLEAFSRGALAAYNWASRNPDKVCCLYGDAPVCDFKSWPGGKGKGPGDPDCWRKCLLAYGLTEEQAMRYRGNPIDNLLPLAQNDIPVIHVCGDSDELVPVDENTKILAERYKRLGGRIQVILKPGVGHNPHSLEDPQPIVDFILDAWSNKCLRLTPAREQHPSLFCKA